MFFLFSSFNSNKISKFSFFSNYKFTSKQRVAVNWKILLASMFMLSLLFKSLLEIKIEIETRLHSIDIYDDDSAEFSPWIWYLGTMIIPNSTVDMSKPENKKRNTFYHSETHIWFEAKKGFFPDHPWSVKLHLPGSKILYNLGKIRISYLVARSSATLVRSGSVTW